tara:strand:- start:769 stop:990 length:222 start_codon:yes stop_codon:yes gene_type:complete
MGNIFNKNKNINNDDLYQSLLKTNLEAKLCYLENKLDNLDNDFYVFRTNTNANIKVISKDINVLFLKSLDTIN